MFLFSSIVAFLVIRLALLVDCSSLTNDYSSIAMQWNVSVYTKQKKKQILNHVSGTAGKGKLHAIIGPSGSGKTTLLSKPIFLKNLVFHCIHKTFNHHKS